MGPIWKKLTAAGDALRPMKRKLLRPEATVPTVVAAAVSWEITLARTVKVRHHPRPAVMEVLTPLIYQTENLVMKVRNIPHQNMSEEVIGRNDIMITKATTWMTKPMVHLTKKAREFQKVQVFLKTRGHLVVTPLQIIQPMTTLMQPANRNKHKEEEKKVFLYLKNAKK